MPKDPSTILIESIIIEVLTNNPETINQVIAQEVNKQLHTNVSTQRIGEIRRSLKISTYQLLNAELMAKRAELLENIPDDPDYKLKDAAVLIAYQCFRNTVIEQYHMGTVPQSQTGDFTDVWVETPTERIPWADVSRFNNAEMMRFNTQVVNKLYTALCYLLDPTFTEDRAIYLKVLKQEYPTKAIWNRPDWIRAHSTGLGVKRITTYRSLLPPVR